MSVQRAFRPYGLTVPLIVAVGGFVAMLAWTADRTSYDTWGGIVVGTVLVLGTFPLVLWLAKREEDPFVARLLPWAMVLKLGASLARLAVAFGVYDGVADANTYHSAALVLGPMYRRGDFSGDVGPFLGTGFLKALTGVVYAVIGPSRLGGFLVFSWFGFWGLYLFYRAFCIGCPEGNRKRYALLVFLLPSLLFWPSSIGKEGWITLTLGLSAYGAARILTHRRGGFASLAVGLVGTVVVRPHVSAILMVSVVAAYLLRRPPAGASITSPLAKLLGIVVLGLALAVAVGQTQDLLGGQDRFNAEAVTKALERAHKQTSEGGSAFANGTTSTDLSPSKFPWAFVSVAFRPFPWESHNALALLASLEGTVLLVLFFTGRRRIVGAVRSLLRTPYVVLCITYSLLFVYGFSSFANFGVLTRQRVQLFPFLLVLLALPPFSRTEQGWRGLLMEGTPDEPDAAERALARTDHVR
ncbi:MAG TPA: hypothetical protein VFJ85_01735 [Acidimicrobiales bacterium]|nr:hypothetical protein [Acidimicrobiales bacterium]